MTVGLPVRLAAGLLLFLSSWGLVACGGGLSPSPSATALATTTARATAANPPSGGLAPSPPIGTANPPSSGLAPSQPIGTATPTAGATAAQPPPGGLAPSQLIGSWRRVVSTADSAAVVTITAYGFHVSDTLGGANGTLVVNGDEIDFFNVPQCGLFLPLGVGRYRWSLQGTTLHFTPLNGDPCPVRKVHFANQDFTKINR